MLNDLNPGEQKLHRSPLSTTDPKKSTCSNNSQR